jgi:hypothetical protein
MKLFGREPMTDADKLKLAFDRARTQAGIRQAEIVELQQQIPDLERQIAAASARVSSTVSSPAIGSPA